MEIFKPVRGFGDIYEVSSLGRLKSIERRDSIGRLRAQRFLKMTTTKDGYKKFHFFLNGVAFHPFAHRIVFEAFFYPIPDGMEINHKNGIRDDNRPENLEILSHAENVRYSKDKLGANYVTYGNAKLTPDCVRTIRTKLQSGLTHKHISTIFNCAESSIWNIAHNRTWTHVD